MADCHAERGEGWESVGDESTAVAGAVIEFVRIRSLLDCTVDADWMGDEFVFPLGAGLTGFRVGECIAECTPGERLLHYASSSPAPRAAVQPR